MRQNLAGSIQNVEVSRSFFKKARAEFDGKDAGVYQLLSEYAQALADGREVAGPLFLSVHGLTSEQAVMTALAGWDERFNLMLGRVVILNVDESAMKEGTLISTDKVIGRVLERIGGKRLPVAIYALDPAAWSKASLFQALANFLGILDDGRVYSANAEIPREIQSIILAEAAA